MIKFIMLLTLVALPLVSEAQKCLHTIGGQVYGSCKACINDRARDPKNPCLKVPKDYDPDVYIIDQGEVKVDVSAKAIKDAEELSKRNQKTLDITDLKTLEAALESRTATNAQIQEALHKLIRRLIQ